MNDFLNGYFSSIKKLQITELPGDGGHRRYARIKKEDKSFMLMSCGKKDGSLKKFIEIQKRLSPFVRVPQLFHYNLNQGFLLLEDLGEQTLEQFFYREGKKSSLPFYYQALSQLILLQEKIIPPSTVSRFDKNFFKREQEMAIYHLQTYINSLNLTRTKPFNERSSRDFKKDMNKVLSCFKPQDNVYCHRDYHSRNLMLKNRKVFLIDFQDAGLGPWFYDLTSLLYDSYISLSSEIKNKLLAFYFKNLPSHLKKKAVSLPHIEQMTKLQFLQRGFKACGRFSAFKNLNQKNTHLKYIKPTLTLLKETALELSYKGIYKYIHKMTETLEKQNLSSRS